MTTKEKARRRLRRSVVLVTKQQRFLSLARSHRTAPQFELHLLANFKKRAIAQHKFIREKRVKTKPEYAPASSPPPNQVREVAGQAAEVQQAISALHLRELDADGDGTIDEAELSEVLAVVMADYDGLQAEGDAALYDPGSLMTRYRNRSDARVLAELDKWWYAAKNEVIGGNTGRDNAAREFMTEAEYSQFYAQLLRAFAEDDDDENDLTPEQAAKAAAEDWAKDSGDDDKVDKEEFYDAVFQLADTWTETTAVAEYVDFLRLYGEQVFGGIVVGDVTPYAGRLAHGAGAGGAVSAKAPPGLNVSAAVGGPTSASSLSPSPEAAAAAAAAAPAAAADG